VTVRNARLSLVALVVCCGLAHAGGFTFDPHLTGSDFQGLANALGDVLTFPNLGTATPTGLTGFGVLGAAGGPKVDTSATWWHYVPHANTVGSVLVGQRVILRKGLPLRFDVGAQFGKVMGEQFWGGEVRWALMEGGMVSPGVALRAAYSNMQSSPLNVDVVEGQLFVSEGFVVVSPYAALGYRRVYAKATFGAPVPASHSVDTSGWTGTVGARVTLIPFLHLVAEFRPGSSRSVYVGLGVGL
jgi:hypothetical protein